MRIISPFLFCPKNISKSTKHHHQQNLNHKLFFGRWSREVCLLFEHNSRYENIIRLLNPWTNMLRAGTRRDGHIKCRRTNERASGKLFKMQYCTMCRRWAAHTHTHVHPAVDLLLLLSFGLQLAAARSFMAARILLFDFSGFVCVFFFGSRVSASPS